MSIPSKKMFTSYKKMSTPSIDSNIRMKRKDKSEKVDQNSKKKQKMDEKQKVDFLTEGELCLLHDEISKILEPLQVQLKAIINAFPQYKQESWYMALETRYQLLQVLPSQVKHWEEFASRPELSSFRRTGLPFTLTEEERGESDYNLIEAKFVDLDRCLQDTVGETKEPPAPSTYCLGRTYRHSQFNPQMAVRDGRTGTAPVALELVHLSFRTFTYWSFINPYPLPGSPAYLKETREIEKDAFIRVYQVANQLLHTMPQFYTSHDDRLGDFKKALLLIFPDNEDYQWCSNISADQNFSESDPVRYKVDLVYRHKRNRVPLIFVEVKLELGEGGNPFWQNHRLYQSYIKNNLHARHNGAPVFLVQLCGTHLGIGGAFCDAIDNNKPPIVLQLGGYVNLQYDFIGRNLREAVNTLWGLYQGINQIPLKWDNFDSRHSLMDIPRYGLHPVVTITHVLHPGVVYLCNYVKGSQKIIPENNLERLLILKVIYSGGAFETYGKEVHQYLESKDMAPKYFFSFHVESTHLPLDPVIEEHHLMEYLSPPSDHSQGWISLLDLEERFPKVASDSKVDIEAALYNIINVLRERNYVHGDMRPNNLLILVEVTPDGKSCIIKTRPDSSPPLPYLKVIDFDWAGIAGRVEYPPHRNPDIDWPGESGMPILSTHDRKMIEIWMSKWTPGNVLVPDQHVPGVPRGEEAVYTRIRT